jgi:hypothetical protein
MTTQLSSKIELLLTQVGTSDPFPMVKDYGNIFGPKGIRTVFFSIGASTSAMADLHIAETIGCPINIFPVSQDQVEGWQAVAACLKDRAPSTLPFLEGVDKAWVLPKNVRVRPALPWWEEGSIVRGGTTHATQKVEKVVSEVCADLKVKDGVQRIDILKLDTGAGMEKGILGAVLDSGFRPGLIIVNWTETPDSNAASTIAAGHLQNCGYVLLGKVGNKFLYFFVDDDMYLSCSWEKPGMTNPIVIEIIRAYRETIGVDKGKFLSFK